MGSLDQGASGATSPSPHLQIISSSTMAYQVDPYKDIDFATINDQTNLAPDEIKCLKNCFDLFDTKKKEFLSADDLGEVLRAMGFRPSQEELMDILKEIDEDGSGEIEFGEFCQLCALFLVEDPDIEHEKRVERCIQSIRQGGSGLHHCRDTAGAHPRAAQRGRRGAGWNHLGARRGRLGHHGL